MPQKVYGFGSKREFDRACRAIRIVERMEPRPKTGKRGRRGGGGGNTLDAIFGVCSVAIPVATGTIAEITPSTTGKAWLYETEPSDGVRTRAVSGEDFVEVQVRHYDPEDGYDVGGPLYLIRADFHDGTQWYETVNPSCGVFPEE
jgi:hypothetical protein